MEITSANDDIHYTNPSYERGNRMLAQKTAAPKKERQFPDWHRFAGDDDGTSDDFHGGDNGGHDDSYWNSQADDSKGAKWDDSDDGKWNEFPDDPRDPKNYSSVQRRRAADQDNADGNFAGSNADGQDPWDARAENEDNSVGGDDTDTDGAQPQGDAAKQSRRRQAYNPNDPYTKNHQDDPDIKRQREEYEANGGDGATLKEKAGDLMRHLHDFMNGGGGGGGMDAGGMAALLSSWSPNQHYATENCGLCDGDGNAPWGDSCPACEGTGNKGGKESARRRTADTRTSSTRFSSIDSGTELFL